MKIHDVAQGSAEWYALRIGIPTASNFHKIVTPKTRQFSGQARAYAFRLAAEILMHRSFEPEMSIEWMQRGRELEPEAVAIWEAESGLVAEPVGFLTTDDGRIGASPDRLVKGEAAALEIKCPAPWTHLEYLIDGFGADYVPQVQGQILVGEFDWGERYSYCPGCPTAPQRAFRDDAWQACLREALDRFLDMRDQIIEVARSKGLFAARAELLTPLDEAVIAADPEHPLKRHLRASLDRLREDDPFGLGGGR